MTVAELQRRMSSRELSEWMALDRLAQPPENPAADPDGLREAMQARAMKALDLMGRKGRPGRRR